MGMKGWEDIRAEVLRRIRARDWQPGAQIPTEEDLAVEFGVARATVNRALRDLAEAGVLERRRKAGTRVAALPVRKATLDIPVIRQEIEARGQTHSFQVLKQTFMEPPVPVASRLGLPPGIKLLYLETLHLADGKPFAFETRWLNSEILPRPMPDFQSLSANEWLVAHVAYVTGDIAFTAEGAGAREAAVLGVPVGAALFITERMTWTAESPITFVRLAHAPGYRVQTLV
jgi:GntR family transcriptional regulator, histidine utilization repressor